MCKTRSCCPFLPVSEPSGADDRPRYQRESFLVGPSKDAGGQTENRKCRGRRLEPRCQKGWDCCACPTAFLSSTCRGCLWPPPSQWRPCTGLVSSHSGEPRQGWSSAHSPCLVLLFLELNGNNTNTNTHCLKIQTQAPAVKEAKHAKPRGAPERIYGDACTARWLGLKPLNGTLEKGECHDLQGLVTGPAPSLTQQVQRDKAGHSLSRAPPCPAPAVLALTLVLPGALLSSLVPSLPPPAPSHGLLASVHLP